MKSVDYIKLLFDHVNVFVILLIAFYQSIVKQYCTLIQFLTAVNLSPERSWFFKAFVSAVNLKTLHVCIVFLLHHD